MGRAILSACLFSLFCIGLSHAQQFRFTAVPDENTARLKQRFDKVAAYLSRELDIPVDYIPVKSYSASVVAYKNNEVQLAWFGGLSGVKARRAVKDAVAIAQGTEDMAFVTYFIANAGIGIGKSDAFPTEVEGRTFTFGSKGSTSGRLMPEFFIRKHLGKPPLKVFNRVGFSGDHSKTLALVQSGSYEVGALNYKVWQNEMAAGNVDTSRVRIIWETPPYPDYNWTIRGDVEEKFGEGLIEKVQRVFLDMKDTDLLGSFPRSGFIRAENAMYGPILDTAIELGIIEN